MTISAQLTFAKGQTVAVANDTAVHNVDLTDTLDFGPTGRPVYAGKDLPVDFTRGGAIPISASFLADNFTIPANSYVRFELFTSSDNSTWVQLSSDIYHGTNSDGGDRFSPSGVLRYLKMRVSYKMGTARGASKTMTVNGQIGASTTTII